jgi:hypothetical protein
MLYVKGDNRLGVTAADVIAHRTVPETLLQELKLLQSLEQTASSSSSSSDWVHDRGRQQQQPLLQQTLQQPSASSYSSEERDKDFFLKAFAQFQHCTDLYIQRMRLILHHVSTFSQCSYYHTYACAYTRIY